ncbi:hypothetical protein [Sphingomonas alpina]|nr:hypothetical protein [Sphingomonas alpina]
MTALSVRTLAQAAPSVARSTYDFTFPGRQFDPGDSLYHGRAA